MIIFVFLLVSGLINAMDKNVLKFDLGKIKIVKFGDYKTGVMAQIPEGMRGNLEVAIFFPETQTNFLNIMRTCKGVASADIWALQQVFKRNLLIDKDRPKKRKKPAGIILYNTID